VRLRCAEAGAAHCLFDRGPNLGLVWLRLFLGLRIQDPGVVADLGDAGGFVGGAQSPLRIVHLAVEHGLDRLHAVADEHRPRKFRAVPVCFGQAIVRPSIKLVPASANFAEAFAAHRWAS
jgi:hypothetical protein